MIPLNITSRFYDFKPSFPISASNTVTEEEEKELEALKSLPLHETKAKKFCIEHPFLFFILDRLDNLVVVAGKVSDPQQPTPFDV